MFINNDTYKIEMTSSGNSFEVDDLIAPAISILNKKGYRTAFCCSGHVDCFPNPQLAYIAFEFGCITPEHLPAGWYWESDGQMEYEYDNATKDMISEVMAELVVWAESLPDTTV